MKITKERYLELGLNLCKEDCCNCDCCRESDDGMLCCDELDMPVDEIIRLSHECPELDAGRLQEEMTEEEYDAWKHNRLEVEG